MYPPPTHTHTTTTTSPKSPEILACKETRRKSDIALGYCFILIRSLQICAFWFGLKFYILLQAGPDLVPNFNLSFWPGRSRTETFILTSDPTVFGPENSGPCRSLIWALPRNDFLGTALIMNIQ